MVRTGRCTTVEILLHADHRLVFQMAAPLHELYRVCADTAARVNSQLLADDLPSESILNDLATSQSKCLEAFCARLRHKASILRLQPTFTSRSPSQVFVSDYNDNDQCMRYTVKCCEDCHSAEHMRQLVPLLRCFQSDAPNHCVLTPLFVRMGGLVAVLAWAHRTAAQLQTMPSSDIMVVLVGVLHIVSKFSVLPTQTVPTGACKLLLDIMGCRLPLVSSCVAAVLRCWMKYAQRHASATIKHSSQAALKPNIVSPATRVAVSSITKGTPAPFISPCATGVMPSRLRTPDSGVLYSRKFVAELCEDEAEGKDRIKQSRRPCIHSHFLEPSKKPAANTTCDAAPLTSPHAREQPMTNIRHAMGTVHAPGNLQPDHFPISSQSSAAFPPLLTPAAFDASATVQALESLAVMLQQDTPSVLSRNGSVHPPQQALTVGHLHSADAIDHNFSELFSPPTTHDCDFFYIDDQFYANDDTSMSSEAINEAFINALQQFSQRDELSGLQSLCARFRT